MQMPERIVRSAAGRRVGIALIIGTLFGSPVQHIAGTASISLLRAVEALQKGTEVTERDKYCYNLDHLASPLGLRSVEVTSPFSRSRLHPTKHIYLPHWGVDLRAHTRTRIYAAGNGYIFRKGFQRNGGGKYLKIQHPSGSITTYLHLDSFAKRIKEGKKVRQGQLIGYSGVSGLQSPQPHLHFAVSINGFYIDPLKIEGMWKNDKVSYGTAGPAGFVSEEEIARIALRGRPAASQGFEKYTVVKDDSLWRIAACTGDTMKDLKVRNNLKSSTIRGGQKFTIKKRHVYIVERGDAAEGLSGILNRHHMTQEQFELCNPDVGYDDIIIPSQRLFVLTDPVSPGQKVDDTYRSKAWPCPIDEQRR